MTTPNMNLDLPVPSSTPGPTWATKVNQAFDAVDAHDHASGNGVKITPAGMNIITDLLFNGNAATSLKAARFQDQSVVPTDPASVGSIVNVAGDLYWLNGAGTAVQLTSGAGINIASVGTIGGDYGQPGVTASVAFSDITKTFTFLRASGETAEMLVGDLNIQNQASGSLSVTIKASSTTAAYEITLPLVAPSADTVLTFDVAGQATFRTIIGTAGEVAVTPSASTHQVSLPSTITKSITFSGNNTQSGSNTHSGSNTFSGATAFTGATTGRGIVPLGAVLATFPSLTGAYACAATTTADSNGFVQCNGQTLSDGTSPMNGVVVPAINDEVFLRGNVTSGLTGGSNANITLATTNLPSHAHDMGHGHSNSFGLTGTTTFAANGHTHGMAHTHQFARTDGNRVWYAQTTRSSGTASWSSGGTSMGPFINDKIPGSGPLITSVETPAAGSSQFFTTGATDDSGNLTSSTGSNSSSASVGFSGSITSHSGNTGNTGSGTSFSVTPKYITARYVMRVK